RHPGDWILFYILRGRPCLCFPRPSGVDGTAVLGHFHFLAGFPGFCGGLRGEFRVSHAAAVPSEPSRVLHHWIGLWVRRFLCACCHTWRGYRLRLLATPWLKSPVFKLPVFY